MTYYEELGISHTASAAEVEQAYQRIAQLLQRQQSEDKLRTIADAQLRRINQMVGVLRDPVQRQKYDEGLREPHAEPVKPMATRPAVPRRVVWTGPPRPAPVTTRREASIWVALFMFPLLGAGWFWYTSQTPTPVTRRVHAASEYVPPTPLRESLSDPDEFNQLAHKSREMAGGWRATLPVPATIQSPPICQVDVRDEHGKVSGTVSFSRWPHTAKGTVALQFSGPVRTDVSDFTWSTADGASGTLQLDQFAPNLLQLQWTVDPKPSVEPLIPPGTVLLGRVSR